MKDSLVSADRKWLLGMLGNVDEMDGVAAVVLALCGIERASSLCIFYCYPNLLTTLVDDVASCLPWLVLVDVELNVETK